ncbi:MAG: hypothetical protein OQK79_08890 [Rhodanobacter sp.]|jgi:hypothetical protein|nr:hypothetical protein [Rhodanobacter sp.]
MSKPTTIMFALLAGVGISANVTAQSSTPAPVDETSQSSQPSATERQLIKPGDRNCLQHTGSLIPARKGECLPVPGRSYSGDELRRTGANSTARALQMLDPSIGLGH